MRHRGGCREWKHRGEGIERQSRDQPEDLGDFGKCSCWEATGVCLVVGQQPMVGRGRCHPKYENMQVPAVGVLPPPDLSFSVQRPQRHQFTSTTKGSQCSLLFCFKKVSLFGFLKTGEEQAWRRTGHPLAMSVDTRSRVGRLCRLRRLCHVRRLHRRSLCRLRRLCHVSRSRILAEGDGRGP